MSTITASDVKRLRELTGVGMMDCKKALEEAGGDFEAAIEILRKKGQQVAATRAEREAKEGVIATAATEERSAGVLLEVNAETDFVARNEEFIAFAERLAQRALVARPENLEAFLGLDFEGGRTVAEATTDMTGKIGEKIEVRRLALLEAGEGHRIVSYVHPGARLGVLVEMEGEDGQEAGRDVAMQVAAMNPIAARREEVPENIRQKEYDIALEAARNEGRPEHLLERIAQGKLERYYKDHVLLEQPFVKDSSLSVQQMLEEADTGLVRYVRYALGD